MLITHNVNIKNKSHRTIFTVFFSVLLAQTELDVLTVPPGAVPYSVEAECKSRLLRRDWLAEVRTSQSPESDWQSLLGTAFERSTRGQATVFVPSLKEI